MPGGFFFFFFSSSPKLIHLESNETIGFCLNLHQWNCQERFPPPPPLPSIFLLSPSVAGVRIGGQTEPAVAFSGPRCQCVAASGCLAGAGQWCCLCCQAAAAALGGRPASLRLWARAGAGMIIKSAKGGELSDREAAVGSCAGSRPWVLFFVLVGSIPCKPHLLVL